MVGPAGAFEDAKGGGGGGVGVGFVELMGSSGPVTILRWP